MNAVRTKYNLLPLKIDTKLVQIAEQLADACASHRLPASVRVSRAASVDTLLAAESTYNCHMDQCDNNESCLNFREIVNQANTHVGCATSTCNGLPSMVCLYTTKTGAVKTRVCPRDQKRDLSDFSRPDVVVSESQWGKYSALTESNNDLATQNSGRADNPPLIVGLFVIFTIVVVIIVVFVVLLARRYTASLSADEERV